MIYKFLLPKQPSEKLTLGINFADDLATGEVISTVTTAAIDLADDSDVKATILDGDPQIGTVSGKTFTPDASGSWIVQKVKAGADGSRYKITIKANTDAPHIFEADVVMEVTEL